MHSAAWERASSNLFGYKPAHVAQAVEHFLGKEKVPGSNPGVGSNVLPRGLIPYPFRNFWKVLGVWSLGGW